MRYDLLSAVWRTPKGNQATFFYRDDTSDWNTISSIMAPSDEYGLAALALSGLALDIGAHIGACAIALALDNPDLSIIAVEPVPPNCMLIQKNVAANGLDGRVIVRHGAAGRSGSRVVRYGFKGNASDEHHAFIGDARDAVPEGKYVSLTVPELSLSDLTTEPVSFVKIDCEGGEYDFLDTDVSQVARIHGEWHPTPPFGMAGRDEIVRMLGATHDLTFAESADGEWVGGFTAIRI